MPQTIVIALGGNALQLDGEAPTIANQRKNVEIVVDSIIDLIEEGNQVVLTHGNGPQVGRLLLQQELSDSPELPASDLDICVAMSQASIGLTIEQVLEEKIAQKKLNKNVATILTEVEVNENDPAFANPTKPIGQYYDQEQAEEVKKEKGYTLSQDSSGRYRRVVPSPTPEKILQLSSIKTLIDNQTIVICCGGGGIPVICKGNDIESIPGVIDKDKVSALLAKDIKADKLVILTAVSEVCINYNKPDQKALHEVTIDELKLQMDQFEKGSMLPKVEACIDFTTNTGNESIITDLEHISSAIKTKKDGTIISK